MGKNPNNADDMKGRVKEAAGDLTGDEGMQREGKVDQTVGKVKDTVDRVADKAKKALGKDEEGR